MLQNQDVVQLQIGYHVLEGKRMPLKKPMAILETQQATGMPSQAADGMDGSSGSVCKVRVSVRVDASEHHNTGN